MTYTDTQLKQALAKMLPELLENYYQDVPLDNFLLSWTWSKREVLNTELLYLCWLVEEDFIHRPSEQQSMYQIALTDVVYKTKHSGISIELALIHATWQQRVAALAKVKGVEIV